MASAEARFREVVDRLADLVRDDDARFLVRSPRGEHIVWTAFNLETPAGLSYAKELIGTEEGKAVLDEVELVLSAAVLERGPQALVAARDGEPETVVSDTDSLKYELVMERLPIATLRDRVWVKRTSKVGLLHSVGWEFSLKVDDDDYLRPGDPVPFGLLRLESMPADAGEADIASGILTLAVDEADVLLLMESLGRLREQFADSE